MEQIIKKIQEYQTIIIHRHTNPDLDALGSQIGLREIIKSSFEGKNVYLVGDENKFSFIGKMDEISDETYKDALVIICDVSVGKIISDKRYFLAKEVIVIDHHNNDCDLSFEDKEFKLPLYNYTKIRRGACAEIIADLLIKYNLKTTKLGLTALYGGIVTDTGRFQYGVDLASSLRTAAYLVENGADYDFIYKRLYVESMEIRQMKIFFQNRIQYTSKNVAYMINDIDVFEKFDVDTFSISRGMVNLMAGIDNVPIWANFTYDRENKNVVCEFRSREIPIIEIAKKYGGGGHDCACGTSLPDFSYVDQVLDDFNKLVEENENV